MGKLRDGSTTAIILIRERRDASTFGSRGGVTAFTECRVTGVLALKHDSIYVNATYTVVGGKCKFKIFPIHRINHWHRAINNILGILHIKNKNTDMTLP